MSEETKETEATKEDKPKTSKRTRKTKAEKPAPQPKKTQDDGKISVEFLETKGNGFEKGMIKRLNKPHAEKLIAKGLAKKA